MVQRVQVVALALAVAIGAGLAAALTLGSSVAPVHVGPTTLRAVDLVDVYTTIVMNLAPPAPAGAVAQRTVSVSRSIYDSCPPATSTPGKRLPANCGRTKVGLIKPDIQAGLADALARQGVTATFGDDGDVKLHQVVTEPTGTPAADGHAADGSEMKFHFKAVNGRLQLQNITLEWVK